MIGVPVGPGGETAHENHRCAVVINDHLFGGQSAVPVTRGVHVSDRSRNTLDDTGDLHRLPESPRSYPVQEGASLSPWTKRNDPLPDLQDLATAAQPGDRRQRPHSIA